MSRVVLYGTLGCHLCEDAQAWLQQNCATAEYVKVDIASDDALVARYGCRIPVLSSGEFEADWPFDNACVAQVFASPAPSNNRAAKFDAVPKKTLSRRVLRWKNTK